MEQACQSLAAWATSEQAERPPNACGQRETVYTAAVVLLRRDQPVVAQHGTPSRSFKRGDGMPKADGEILARWSDGSRLLRARKQPVASLDLPDQGNFCMN